MKKIILSASLVIAFVLYGLHQRQEDALATASVGAKVTPVATEVATPALTPTATPATTSSPTASATASPTATATPTPTPTATPSGQYKDGSYTGSVADAFYGNVQVQAVVSGGKLTAVTFLQYPNDRSTSVRINQQAMPILEQEAIQIQSSKVDGVSGASDTSAAFNESLAAALAKAS